MIDLRSDTVTKPTPAMLEAMAKAEVGDDVYGEDPTINRLQEKCAELFGKEAGLFVSSGSQGNLVSLLAHCQRGDEIIVGKNNHIFQWEQGGAASLGGIHTCTIDNRKDGMLPIEEIEAAIRYDDPHCPVSKLVCIENTQDGRVLSKEYTESVGQFCREKNLLLHLDGARIYNAAIALKLPVKSPFPKGFQHRSVQLLSVPKTSSNALIAQENSSVAPCVRRAFWLLHAA
jgi:threonine aldolase